MKPNRGLCSTLPIAVAFVALGSIGCGPSFQVIYEGNARFEHCYALEESPRSLVPERADCWRDWSEHYTYGQTRDRIHYATARYVALSQSVNAPTDEAMMMAAPGMAPRQSSITAPLPTNAFAPPPKVLDGDYLDGGAARAARAPLATARLGAGADGGASDAGANDSSRLPASGCSEGCGAKYRQCSAGCTGADAGSGAKNGACSACESTYKTCMRGCFK